MDLDKLLRTLSVELVKVAVGNTNDAAKPDCDPEAQLIYMQNAHLLADMGNVCLRTANALLEKDGE